MSVVSAKNIKLKVLKTFAGLDLEDIKYYLRGYWKNVWYYSEMSIWYFIELPNVNVLTFGVEDVRVSILMPNNEVLLVGENSILICYDQKFK